MEIMKERTHSGEDFMRIKYFLIGNQITPEITLNVSEAPFGDTLGVKRYTVEEDEKVPVEEDI